jgi:hypothetical protein
MVVRKRRAGLCTPLSLRRPLAVTVAAARGRDHDAKARTVTK